MNYVISGTWDEWQDYIERHQLENSRYVTSLSQLPDRLRKGHRLHLIGTWRKRTNAEHLAWRAGELLKEATQ